MAIYDYKCKNCGREYEYFHSGTKDKDPKCPHCNSSDAEKQVSKNTGFKLKGGCWAKDRYGK